MKKNAKRKTQNAKRGNGFTLIELLVVISIIGILSGFMYSVFSGVQMRARDGQRKAALRSIQHALEQYRADQNSYPSAVPLPSCPVTQITSPDCSIVYMQKIPTDPSGFGTGGAYFYIQNSSFKYTLVSCIENTHDTDTNVTSTQPSGAPSCSTNTYYLLNNP